MRLVTKAGLAVAVLAAGVAASRQAASAPAPAPAAQPAAAASPAPKPVATAAPGVPAALRQLIDARCTSCHDADEKKGDLDLTALAYEPADAKSYAKWVSVFDRVHAGEMPPKKKLTPAEKSAFETSLGGALTQFDAARAASAGRATQRRLNRYEYENAVRDLLGAPWLQIRDSLPEDGEAFRFNKVGDALDVSHVQIARYMAAADYALREVAAHEVDRPAATTKRYYARQEKNFLGKMKFSVFNTRPERATFPVLGTKAQPDVRAGNAPASVGAKDPKTR
ncbi:MAG TPA: DUF1587 domain-containing protein, partial [Humisphaera sp.]